MLKVTETRLSFQVVDEHADDVLEVAGDRVVALVGWETLTKGGEDTQPMFCLSQAQKLRDALCLAGRRLNWPEPPEAGPSSAWKETASHAEAVALVKALRAALGDAMNVKPGGEHVDRTLSAATVAAIRFHVENLVHAWTEKR